MARPPFFVPRNIGPGCGGVRAPLAREVRTDHSTSGRERVDAEQAGIARASRALRFATGLLDIHPLTSSGDEAVPRKSSPESPQRPTLRRRRCVRSALFPRRIVSDGRFFRGAARPR